MTGQVESHGTESERAGAEKEAGSAGGGEGQGGEQEHREFRPEEPRDEEERGGPEPQTEPGPADREGARGEGTLRAHIKDETEQNNIRVRPPQASLSEQHLVV